jgi:hypothetical protein
VHYRSRRPAQLGALAYTQGTDIFVAPGQEGHLPHEAWHVVQQAQGRVRRSTRLMKMPVNDDAALEHEAEVMGARAAAPVAAIATPLVPASSGIARRVVQRITMPEASDAIEREDLDLEWYQRVVVPALSTIARRSGQSYPDYLAPLSDAAFLQTVRELAAEFKQEPQGGLKPKPVGLLGKLGGLLSTLTFVDSDEYQGMKLCVGTNLLVLDQDHNFDNGVPTQRVKNFVKLYQSGNLVWARGVGISHFGWDALRKGVVASEGTADIPTFTMGNAVPTRWLPGVYVPKEATDIGFSVPPDAAGMREMMTRKDVPTGATALYKVPPTAPVAYLNDGEQVVRGPLHGADVSIYCVVMVGPGPIKYVAQNSKPTDLPPAAPYQAAVGSPAILAWEAAIDDWSASL